MKTPKEFLKNKWSAGNYEDHCIEDIYNIMKEYNNYVLQWHKQNYDSIIILCKGMLKSIEDYEQ